MKKFNFQVIYSEPTSDCNTNSVAFLRLGIVLHYEDNIGAVNCVDANASEWNLGLQLVGISRVLHNHFGAFVEGEENGTCLVWSLTPGRHFAPFSDLSVVKVENRPRQP